LLKRRVTLGALTCADRGKRQEAFGGYQGRRMSLRLTMERQGPQHAATRNSALWRLAEIALGMTAFDYDGDGMGGCGCA